MLKISKPVTEDQFTVSSPFGVMRHLPHYEKPRKHWGIDIPLEIGTDIVAVADGTVAQVSDHGQRGFGKFMVQKTVFEQDSYYYFYAHLDACLIEVGTTVSEGECIAKSGNSGQTTGAHLHFQLMVNGFLKKDYPKYCKDPMLYFKQCHDKDNFDILMDKGVFMKGSHPSDLITKGELAEILMRFETR
jgi:murein DD-endopeptidase MepM/ murein hydrolase activator NlpD